MKKVWKILTFLLVAGVLFPASHARAQLSANIIVGVNIHNAPYSFLDAGGHVQGLCVDLFYHIAESGRLNVTFAPYRSDMEAYRALDKGEIDVVLGAKSLATAGFDFEETGELVSSELCIVAKNRVAEQIMHMQTSYLDYSIATDVTTQILMGLSDLDQSRLGNAMRHITYNDAQILDILQEDKAQLGILDKQNAIYMLTERGISEEYTIVNNHFSNVTYTLFVRSSDKTLQHTLKVELSNLRLTQTYQSILAKWLQEDASDILKKWMRIALWAGAAALVILGAILYINILLKHKVTQKTMKLQMLNEEHTMRMAQLEQEQRFNRELIENYPSGLVIFDEQWRIAFINHQALALAGYDKEARVDGDVRRLPLFGRILEVTKDAAGETLTGVLSVNGNTAKKKDYHYMLCRPRITQYESHELIMVMDVTEEEQLRREEQEREKYRVTNMLVAGIAHEIKNPLMTIQTYACILPEQLKNEEYLRSFAKYIPQEVSRIDKLVQTLINYARPAKGLNVRFDFADAVRESLYLADAFAYGKTIAFCTELEESAIVIMDKDKLKQSILNVAINAVESTMQKLENEAETERAEPMRIRIWTQRENRSISLHIRDEGCGMSEEQIRCCTEPFVTTKPNGTGMGMCLVKQYVQDNGGALHIESEQGVYTEITLTFEEADHVA